MKAIETKKHWCFSVARKVFINSHLRGHKNEKSRPIFPVA